MKNLSKTFRFVNEYNQSITFEYGSGYIINKPVGIDIVDVQLTQAQGINQVGATVENRTIQPRQLTINGKIVGENQRQRKEELLSVVRPCKGKLYADDWYLDVFVTSTPTIEPRDKFAKFQFSLNAPYPYWQNANINTRALTGVAPKFKFPWNISREYRFGEFISSQYIVVQNSGHVPVPFTVHFEAIDNVKNPRITNMVTGEFLLLNKSMIAGERVDVEITHNRTTVKSSVDGDIRGALDLDSNLFRLAVGDNALKPEAESGMDNLEVRIEYATEIVGVSV